MEFNVEVRFELVEGDFGDYLQIKAYVLLPGDPMRSTLRKNIEVEYIEEVYRIINNEKRLEREVKEMIKNKIKNMSDEQKKAQLIQELKNKKIEFKIKI